MTTQYRRGNKNIRLVYPAKPVRHSESMTLPSEQNPFRWMRCIALGTILGVAGGVIVCLFQLLTIEEQYVTKYYHLTRHDDEIRHQHISRLTLLALNYRLQNQPLAEGITWSIGWAKEITDLLVGKHIEPRDLEADAIGRAEAKQQLKNSLSL